MVTAETPTGPCSLSRITHLLFEYSHVASHLGWVRQGPLQQNVFYAKARVAETVRSSSDTKFLKLQTDKLLPERQCYCEGWYSAVQLQKEI